jgi:hypothetical protein
VIICDLLAAFMVPAVLSLMRLLRSPDEPGLASAAADDSLVTSAPSTR